MAAFTTTENTLTLSEAFQQITTIAEQDHYQQWSMEQWEDMVSTCLHQIQRQGIFSSNEEFDDVATEYIPVSTVYGIIHIYVLHPFWTDNLFFHSI